MTFIKAPYIDHLNIALIVLSCIAAHYFPYHLFLLSYAVLGPAHYLTQISWLHDRNYFANGSFVLPLFLLLTLLLCISPAPMVTAFLLSVTLALALVSVMPAHRNWRASAAIGGFLFTCAIMVSPKVAMFIAVLLPTILHVFVFTALFMWIGAIKSGRMSAYCAFFSLLICAMTFLLPTQMMTAPNLAGIGFFTPLAAYMNSLLPSSIANPTQLFGFLGFAYTYHYLNWFSKAEIIRWHQIPRARMLIIVIVYILSVSVYAYDYKAGFLLLLILSILHVLLEFPLNLRTVAAIATTVSSRAARQMVRNRR